MAGGSLAGKDPSIASSSALSSSRSRSFALLDHFVVRLVLMMISIAWLAI